MGLITPAEIYDYLSFRESYIKKWGKKIEEVPEPALLGQYLIGDEVEPPNMKFMDFLATFKQDLDSWDLAGIIKAFPEKMQNYESSKDYYSIVREIAKLMRTELKAFKERFQISMEIAKDNNFPLPYRFAVPRTNCGFLFIPLGKELESKKKEILTNLALMNKYDLKLQRCIGVTFICLGNGNFDIDWCFIDFPWKQNNEIEKRLKDSYPFREAKEKLVNRYEFIST